jgi:hypothetical protein
MRGMLIRRTIGMLRDGGLCESSKGTGMSDEDISL